jgi:hypothetical protein
MSKALRNQAVIDFMSSFFERAASGKFEIPLHVDTLLSKVFLGAIWGFREILMVITIARLLDPNYKASTSFYECNPRAIFEGPIREMFGKFNIPHRQSGPLNIAKATIGINSQWAAQRRPAELAQATLQLVNYLEGLDKRELEEFSVALHAKFLEEAKRVANHSLSTPTGLSIEYLLNFSIGLIQMAPDGGNTPQRIVGYLLESLNQQFDGRLTIEGHTDRASTTNTTSKKAGDIVESLNGKVINVYEVTVKPFGSQRLREAVDSINAYNSVNEDLISEVKVICRKEDCHDFSPRGGLFMTEVFSNGVRFVFLDIAMVVESLLSQLNEHHRVLFLSKLQQYASHHNTAEKVKTAWQTLSKAEEQQ